MTPPSSLGLGWLQGTLTGDAGYLAAALACYLSVDGEVPVLVTERDGGDRWYRRRYDVGVHGSHVCWSPRSSGNEREVMFSVTQTDLDRIGWGAGLGLAMRLRAEGGRFSRVDVYYDDRAREVDPEVVRTAFLAGHVRTHIRRQRYTSSGARGEEEGATLYLGSREGEFMLRVYRKWVESGNATDGVRWEAEFKGTRASAAIDEVLSAEAPTRAFWAIVSGFIEFRERAEGGRGDRGRLLGWWAALVKGAGRARLAAPVVVDSLGRRLGWMRRQVSPSLAVMVATQGPEGLRRMVADGLRRCGPRDRRLIAAFLGDRFRKSDTEVMAWVKATGATWQQTALGWA